MVEGKSNLFLCGGQAKIEKIYVLCDHSAKCIEKNVLKEILTKQKAEVVGMILTMEREEYEELLKNEFREEGLAEGLREGSEREAERLNKLNMRLLSENKLEELKRASQDREYQKTLLQEYGL